MRGIAALAAVAGLVLASGASEARASLALDFSPRGSLDLRVGDAVLVDLVLSGTLLPGDSLASLVASVNGYNLGLGAVTPHVSIDLIGPGGMQSLGFRVFSFFATGDIPAPGTFATFDVTGLNPGFGFFRFAPEFANNGRTALGQSVAFGPEVSYRVSAVPEPGTFAAGLSLAVAAALAHAVQKVTRPAAGEPAIPDHPSAPA